MCQICELLRKFFFARIPFSANLFSANEPDLYGEVSGLNFGRCVWPSSGCRRKVSDYFFENIQPFAFFVPPPLTTVRFQPLSVMKINFGMNFFKKKSYARTRKTC